MILDFTDCKTKEDVKRKFELFERELKIAKKAMMNLASWNHIEINNKKEAKK